LEAQVETLRAAVAEREAQAETLRAAIAERDGEWARLEEQAGTLTAAIAERDQLRQLFLRLTRRLSFTSVAWRARVPVASTAVAAEPERCLGPS
jgi:hypothetical protein